MTILESRTRGLVRPGFTDPASSTRFELLTPDDDDDLWDIYLAGALGAYQRFGVEHALELDAIRNGRSTSIFVVGHDRRGECVAGVRVQGPFTEPDQAHVIEEFDGFAGARLLREAIAQRIPEGVVEFKGGWVRHGHPHHEELSDALARCFVHILEWSLCRYGLCSAALYATKRWESSGGRLMSNLTPVPYPDERYQTSVLWWDRTRIATLASQEQWRRLQWETEEPSVAADDQLATCARIMVA